MPGTDPCSPILSPAGCTPQLKAREDEVINLTSVHTTATAQYDRRVSELEAKAARLTEHNRWAGGGRCKFCP